MKLPRRRFLQLAAGAAALPAASRLAWAQAYPVRPVRWIAGFPPGGPTDTVGRLMGQWLSERLGQAFVIDNRPGAAGNIAIEAAVNAAPDGYTLLLVNAAGAINATLYDKLNFSLVRDIAPVAGIIRTPLVMAVNPSVPVNSVSEFIAYAKANPGKINMASGGIGTPQHVAGELFKMMTGVNMLHVPYRGEAPALTDMLGGQVQVTFGTMPGTIEYVRSGKLRPLAVTTATRWEGLPDLPTVGDFLPGFEASFWAGAGVPRKTPAEIIDRLNHEINLGLADPRLKARLADLGGTTLPGSPAEFGKFMADEVEKWGKVVKFAGAKPD
jgi:tripartite-type tricarboxylate transporter receptor subunit TctC